MAKRFLKYETENPVGVDNEGVLKGKLSDFENDLFYVTESRKTCVEEGVRNFRLRGGQNDGVYYDTLFMKSSDNCLETSLYPIGTKIICVFDGEEYEFISSYINSSGYAGNVHLHDPSEESTGEDICLYYGGLDSINIYTTRPGEQHTVAIYVIEQLVTPIEEKFIPELSSIVLKSIDGGSTIKFRVTVDDSGMLTTRQIL